MAYCPLCGNSGVRPDGSVCSCRLNDDVIFSDIRGVDVPEQYIGLRYNPVHVPTDLGPVYAQALDRLHTEITTLQMRNKNIILCAPAKHSKTIWAYSCIQNLFRQRAPVCPIIDVLEFARLMHAFSDSDDWYDVPYLFLKIPTEVNQTIRATITTIIDRRVRRGNSTIFLYDGTWGMLTYDDKFGTLKNLQGDGSFHSVEVKSFRPKEEQSNA